jgi:hypothetical protein
LNTVNLTGYVINVSYKKSRIVEEQLGFHYLPDKTLNIGVKKNDSNLSRRNLMYGNGE